MSHAAPRPTPASFAATVVHDLAQPKESKADPTTERILRSGVQELMEFGFRRTTIENVAKRADVARMTVYRRFPSKEALAQAVLAREVVNLMQAVDRTVDRGAPFETRWVEGFVVMLQSVHEHQLFRRLLASDPDATVLALTLGAEPLITLARGFLAAFIRTNLRECRPRDAEWAAETALRLCQSFILTPSRCVRVDEPAQVRAYARAQVLPILNACRRVPGQAPEIPNR